MKYPIGTKFIPHHPQFTGGVVVEHKGGKYRVEWDDGIGNTQYYSERKMDELIKELMLTWRLPYTINHEGYEDLFKI